MKLRAVSFVLLLALGLLLLASCGPSQKEITDGSTNPPSDPIPVVTLRANAEGKEENGRIEQFYTDRAPESVAKEAIAKFLTEDQATAALAELFADSDEVSSLPILGTYLEKTSLFVCLFKKQGALIGTHALAVDPDGNVTGELCTLLGGTVGTPFADATCFEKISACLSAYPDFELLGFVYQMPGLRRIYPVGKNAEDDRILYYENELTEFRLVEPFSTIEDGRAAFDAYWAFRATVLSSLQIFEWTNYDRYPYINKYRYQDVCSSGADAASYQYLYDSDWYLLVPLLNTDGEEGDCALYLLYQNNKLIAETILQVDPDGVIRAVKERVSDKDPATGEYTGLDGIDYAAACQRILPSDQTTVKGIGFDGESYFVVYR
ncbi:MAG: hypothetical protein IKP74_07210 [Clostridia bacterium]|nr:hypothetical protein [Clostridia bacterium]